MTATWTDLEIRFRALLPAMKFYRLDYQWGSAGEHWYLKGGVSNADTSQFETLATIAGDLLLRLPRKAVAPEALAEGLQAKHRWYLAVWHHMTYKTPEHMGFETRDGKDIGRIFSGTIDEPVQLSATLCLRFSTIGAAEPLVSLPTPVTRWGRASRWVGHQYKEHGALWGLIGTLVGIVLAVLAIIL